jgi:hypothetical protein
MKYLMMLSMVVFPTVANAQNVYHSLSDNPTGETPTYSWEKTPTPIGDAASRGYTSAGGYVGFAGGGGNSGTAPSNNKELE